ncbi:MAG TPA: M48 family metalloprotease [Gemmatimonadales bacterium]|nr:M48 family metalloprotease [Gemmatimonadales bacterium]
MSPLPERRHFADEQRRNRRQSRRFSIVAVPAVVAAGLPLCIVISPILFAVVLLAASVWDLLVPLSPGQWSELARMANALPELWEAVRGRPSDVAWGPLAALLLAPGLTVMLVAWPFVRRLSRMAGAGSILARIPSREPDLSRLAEQQLFNAVQEMAVSAGLPAPGVRIIDSRTVNIVAIGLTTDDATLLATEGFLKALDRDERQAMIAHLVGSVGNGDLEIAAIILSVVETWALVTALFEAVLFSRQRTLVRDFMGASARMLRGSLDAATARSIVDRLLGGTIPDPMEVAESFQPESLGGVLYGLFVLIPMLATLGIASIAARTASSLFTMLGFGPWLAAMWRARRRLADATAVQLTRNPTALAGAIRKLGESDVEIREAWAVNFLFPVWVPVTLENSARARGAGEIVGMRLETEPRLEHLAALGASLETGKLTWGARLRRSLGGPEDLVTALGWASLALVLSALLLLASVALTAWLLGVLWGLLQWVVPRARQPS